MAPADSNDQNRGQGGGTGFMPARLSAWFSIAVERFWPLVLGLSGLVGLFLILAWTGIFAAMPAPARIAVLAALCLAALWLAWRNRHLRLPGAAAVTARVEEASHLANQPLRAQEERALGDDPVSMALWRIHQKRMAERLTGLTGGLPNTRTERLDPYGLRVLVALGVVTAFAYSFGPGGGRISDATTPLEGTCLLYTSPSPRD